MKTKLTYFLFFISSCLLSQNDSLNKNNHFVTTEILLGETLSTNPGFPDTKLHKGLSLHFGNTNTDNKDEWAYRLKYPETGISFLLTDYGNPEYLGYSFSTMSFIEYGLLKKYTNRLSMQLGMGASYFTYTYKNLPYAFNNPPENNSRGVSTRATWLFKVLFNYALIKKENAAWKIGFGLLHQSNGHTKSPNNGYNSVLVSLSRQAFYKETKLTKPDGKNFNTKFNKNSQFYFDIRLGLGVNAISEDINNRNGVYTIAPSFGKILNKTFKIGLGFYYRFYENYYKYITNEGLLVVEDNPQFMEKPYLYSSNFGVFITSELLLGHFGLEATLGYNIYKPFYETDWRLNKGFYWEVTNPDGTKENKYFYGEKDEFPKGKEAISTRLGLRYYIITNEKAPKNNFYIGANINANLGQADFTEVSFGYIHSFGLKTKK